MKLYNNVKLYKNVKKEKDKNCIGVKDLLEKIGRFDYEKWKKLNVFWMNISYLI